MPARTISQHVAEVMDQVEKVRKLSVDEKVQLTVALHALFKKIRSGAIIIDPLYDDNDVLADTVVRYRKSVARADVLDDPPSQYPFVV